MKPPKQSAPLGQWRVFSRLRARLVRNLFRFHMRESRLRIVTILISCLVFWCLLFALFFEAFHFINRHLPLSNQLIAYLISLFFFSLTIMLSFSTGIIIYTGMFRSREAHFLLTTPSDSDKVFAFKFQDALVFSSWGFLLLGSPLMTAYGVLHPAPWWFYPTFVAYFAAYVVIPGAMGAIACQLIIAWLPKYKKTFLVLMVAASLVGVAAWVARSFWVIPDDLLSESWVDSLLLRMRFSRAPLWPSRWISDGLVSAAESDWRTAGFYFLLLVANAGFLYLVAASIAMKYYRSSFSTLLGLQSKSLHRSWYWLDEAFNWTFRKVPGSIRLLILKDLRTFRRDPVQWSQLLIFFGLLALYFFNIRRLNYDLYSVYWRNLASFLNLTVTALILSTFTSRFVFPMVSLEGKRFWILGLLPMHREHILWGKFGFAAGGALIVSESLVVVSDWMLRISLPMVLLHVGTVLVLCLGLAGISVGLGARIPNLTEDDPSKIAAGFGGTLNLVISLCFIVIIVTLLALPCHVYYVGLEARAEPLLRISERQFLIWMGGSIASAILIGVLATILPMRMGVRAFRNLEV